MSHKAVVLFSGGLDSTALLGYFQHAGFEPCALSIDYGQRHIKELEAALKITTFMKVKHQVVRLNHLRNILKGSSLTSSNINVPEGHYEDASMKATVVPNRNMILMAIAGGYAISLGAKVVGIAAHSGDHAIYPDCRPEFLEAMRVAFRLCDYRELELQAPFANYTKEDVVLSGADMNVPLHLTWSCYKGEELHCGVCGTCVERKEAFATSGISDPTGYNE